MTLFKPCIAPTGPTDAKIVLLGEAPGESEEIAGIPFVGSSGQLLSDLCRIADIDKSQCYQTNVLTTRPPQNKLEHFLGKRDEGGVITEMPALLPGRYLRNDFRPDLVRLRSELQSVRPNLIIALGNTACWAVLRQTAISKIRGTVVASQYGKVLPTYHPAAIFRQWDLRPIVIADLMKARMESEYKEIRRPQRQVIINPDFQTIAAFYNQAKSARGIAVDIETSRGQITCIGFAISRNYSLVVPFVDHRMDNNSFWRTLIEEIEAWRWVQRLLNLPQPKIFQNGLYDLQYIRRMKLTVINALEDTMLLHHAMHPELLKGLGFLGSVYTNEPAWKLMRKRGEDNLKADDE
ncbi:MAG TPA: uracil-DNA glycosylase family protein [Pirellula sp.]|nr:uracil-DNA glycosylase family protein [Pirellula sp.]